MAGAFDITLFGPPGFDIRFSAAPATPGTVTRLRSAPMMTVLNNMYTNLDGIDNFDRMNVIWLYPLSVSDQTPAGGGGVFQPVMHRQQGTVFAPGYNDRTHGVFPF